MDNVIICWLGGICLALVLIILIQNQKQKTLIKENKQLERDLADSDEWAGHCRTEANENGLLAGQRLVEINKLKAQLRISKKRRSNEK